jgi:hypothetical protein
MSDEQDDADRRQREITEAACAAAREVVRKLAEEMEKATREGRLDEYLESLAEDMRRRGRDAELN